MGLLLFFFFLDHKGALVVGVAVGVAWGVAMDVVGPIGTAEF